MYSPLLQITTITDGSGGSASAQAEIDWSLCDCAEITLSAGSGSYSIEHINIIPGKEINVAVTNDGATGQLLWSEGEAVVDWGPEGQPPMPGVGETVEYEFYASEQGDIKGRLYFADHSALQSQLNSINSRLSVPLFDSTDDSSSVGSSETALHTYVIQSNQLSRDGDKFIAEYAIEFAASPNAKQLKLKLNDTVIIFDTGSLAITAQSCCDLRLLIIRKSQSTARAVATISGLAAAVAGGSTQITDETDLSGLDFLGESTVRLTGTGTDDGDVTHRISRGEYQPAAI